MTAATSPKHGQSIPASKPNGWAGGRRGTRRIPTVKDKQMRRGGGGTVGKDEGQRRTNRLTNSYSSKSWMSEARMKVWNPCRKAFI